MGAENGFQAAIAIESRNANANHGLGGLQMQQGKFAEAEASLRIAIEVDPQREKAHYDLGVILERNGDLIAAASSYESAVALDPLDVDAQLKVSRASGSMRLRSRRAMVVIAAIALACLVVSVGAPKIRGTSRRLMHLFWRLIVQPMYGK